MLNYTLLQRFRHFLASLSWVVFFYRIYRLLFTATYREDGLITIHNADFLQDRSFIEAYKASLCLQSNTNIRWRAHVVQWAANHAKSLDGDFVECGVNRAFLSMSAMNFINFKSLTTRRFYLFDTYSGLVDDLVSSEDKAAYKNVYTDTYEFVRNTFRNWHNVVIVKGIVPDSLGTVSIDRLAYLSIDMNCAKPEAEALRYFWPKLVKGGVIILDDYGFSGHESQKQAADQFAASVGVMVLSLPTGQGVLIKPSE